MLKSYNKLVRDLIPSILEKNNHRGNFKTLTMSEFKLALMEKLDEEVREVINAPENDIEEEIADLLEVLQAIYKAYNLSEKRIIDLKDAKKISRGAFDKKLFLTNVEIDE